MLDILKELQGKIVITRQVKDEFGKNVPEWIEVEDVNDKKLKTLLIQVKRVQQLQLLKGIRILLFWMILAQKLNLKITGTVGIIIKARKKNVITSIAKVLNK